MILFLIEQIEVANEIPTIGWIYAFIGWLVYNLYRMDEQSTEFDLDGDGYSFKEVGLYLKKSWIKITISFLLVIYGVFEMQIIWGWVLSGQEFHDASYFVAGFLAVALQFLMDKYGKKT
jgi:hypothetical protein